MNSTTRILFIAYAVVLTVTLAVSGCATLTRLKTAIADLDVKGPATCELYVQKGRGIAEAAWTHDWPVFAPMLDTPPDAEADEAFCRRVITDRGAKILTKPPGQQHSTAVVFAVFLDPDFESRSAVRQAATMCHEAVHIVWQHRVGIPMAIADYATVSGRLSTEAVAYAWGDMVLSRNGVTPEWIVGARRQRADRFPETYKLSRLVSSECVYDYLTAVSDALEERVES